MTEGTDQPTDAELVTEVLNGDRASYGMLVERHQSVVCALLYSRLGQDSVVEDIAQDAFISAYTKLSTLRERPRFRAWLITIALNLAGEWLRRRNTEDRAIANSYNQEQGTSNLPTPSQELERRQMAEAVWGAVQALPEGARQAILLHYVGDLSDADIAKTLGISASAVRSRLQYGRDRLRETMLPHAKEVLERNRPTTRFTKAVVACLPLAVAAPSRATPLLFGLSIKEVSVFATGVVVTAALVAGVLARAPRTPDEERPKNRVVRLATAEEISRLAGALRQERSHRLAAPDGPSEGDHSGGGLLGFYTKTDSVHGHFHFVEATGGQSRSFRLPGWTITWSGDGHTISFVAPGRSSASGTDIFVMPAGPVDSHKLVDDARTQAINITDDAVRQAQPSLSMDGEWVAFETHDGSSGRADVEVMKTDGTARTVLTGTVDGRSSRPAISPKGDRVVLEVARLGQDGGVVSEIWTVNTDGTGLHPIVQHPLGRDSSPAWSPDGQTILWTRGKEIWSMGRDGTNRRRLLHIESYWSVHNLAVSPDGTIIAMQAVQHRRAPDSNEMWVVNSDGSGLLSLGHGSHPQVRPFWVPTAH